MPDWTQEVYLFPLENRYLGTVPPSPLTAAQLVGAPVWVEAATVIDLNEIQTASDSLDFPVFLDSTQSFHTTRAEAIVRMTVSAPPNVTALEGSTTLLHPEKYDPIGQVPWCRLQTVARVNMGESTCCHKH